MQVLSHNQPSLKDIFKALPESAYAKNVDGIYIACSQRMAILAGYDTPEDIIGKTDNELKWGEQAATLIQNDRKVMETEETLIAQERGHCSIGGMRLFRTIKSPLYDNDKKVIGVTGISFDITDMLHLDTAWADKLAADAAMEKAESDFLKKWYQEISGQKIAAPLALDEIGNKLKTYMEGIIDKLPANIYWMDLDGYILGCNQQMASVLGYENRNDIIGEHTLKFLQAHECEQVLENNKRAVQTNEVIVFEETAQFEGEEKIFLSHKSALQDENGAPISLVGVSFDITERKRIERELKIAKEEAEAANLAKLHFMNNMRHDIRTPLSCVVGSARILKAIETDPEKAEFIEGILTSSQHLLQMLTNMLEFDRVQSKEKNVELTTLSIRNLGEGLLGMLKLTAQAKNLKFILDIDSNMPDTVRTDSYRLQRILMNLLNNAVKFTHKGSVTLRIEQKNQNTYISVKDTGIGIDPARKGEVFDKFVRLVASDKGLYEGEGLGLAIVKQFVEELDGTIELESQPGIGSAFTVILPSLNDLDAGLTKEVMDESIIS